MNQIIPVWTSTYSMGSSILTLDSVKDVKENGPKSIIKLCIQNDINDIFLLENNMSGFVSAYKQCRDNKLNLRFGLKLVCCENLNIKTQDSLRSEHKINIWAKGDEGYHRLIKIYSAAAVDGFYYRPRIDLNTIRELWNDDHLMMSIPFYYSFIHRNLMHDSRCIIDINFTKPYIERQNNSIPFNFIINEGLDNWQKTAKWPEISVHPIYYEKKKDFKYLTAYKCLQDRTTLEVPEIDHHCSDEFCLENYKMKCIQ